MWNQVHYYNERFHCWSIENHRDSLSWIERFSFMLSSFHLRWCGRAPRLDINAHCSCEQSLMWSNKHNQYGRKKKRDRTILSIKWRKTVYFHIIFLGVFIRFVSISAIAHSRRLCARLHPFRWHTIERHQPRTSHRISWGCCKWQTIKI